MKPDLRFLSDAEIHQWALRLQEETEALTALVAEQERAFSAERAQVIELVGQQLLAECAELRAVAQQRKDRLDMN